MVNKKETITIKKDDVEEVVLDVKYPTGKDYADADIIYVSTWNKAVRKGALIKDRLEDFLKEHGLWDNNLEKKKDALNLEIDAMERKLLAGEMKLSQGKELSLKILKKREELTKLLSKRFGVERNTAESLAEDAKFNYLVSVCTLNAKDGSCYFDGVDDYMLRSSTEEARRAAVKLATMIYLNFDSDPDAHKKEIQFLKRYNLINDKGQLVNRDGKAVDEHGRLIDDEGRYINENGEYVDINNNRVNKDGSVYVEEGKFYDDDDNVVEPVTAK